MFCPSRPHKDQATSTKLEFTDIYIALCMVVKAHAMLDQPGLLSRLSKCYRHFINLHKLVRSLQSESSICCRISVGVSSSLIKYPHYRDGEAANRVCKYP